VLNAGAPDPLLTARPAHQGRWTPLRPYLTWQHTYAPETSNCHYAALGGVPAGVRPGTSDRWQLCFPHSCPGTLPIPMDPHPISYALRQDIYWWDAQRTRWSLCSENEDEYCSDTQPVTEREFAPPLTDEHLVGVITWLRATADRLQLEELKFEHLPVPCPVNAYPGAPERWIADTPFMRAALIEAERRGLSVE
jgi:hypothetical protein